MNGQDIRNRKVTVLGAARSGLAAARLLKSQGVHVFVSDKESAEKLKVALPSLQSAGIPFEVGGHTDRVYDCSLMVISPGVPSNAPVVVEAQKRGINVVSEMELASWFCKAPILAVTGSNGKTTTTTLVGKIFEHAKRKCVVAGNIGTAFSSVVLDLDQESIAIVEVSSFQLDHIQSFHPKTAVILNITPDHLDRYGKSFENYTASKCRVFENQTMEDFLVYGFDDPMTSLEVRKHAPQHVRALPFTAKARLDDGAYVDKGRVVISESGRLEEIVDVKDISIKGLHNLYNSMAAALAARIMGVAPEPIRETLKTFEGVEHRLESVRELNGVKYVNDSKATNVDSVWYALQSFDEPLIVLMGGRDKGNDYSRLNDLVREHVKAIVAIGESAGKVTEAFQNITTVEQAESMEAAVKTASRLAARGDVVLLSPACTSFDWFENFEHRGRVFKEIVRKL
jgi:UDP-N-acetylmuramoylalanine--D-glutamate ligase